MSDSQFEIVANLAEEAEEPTRELWERAEKLVKGDEASWRVDDHFKLQLDCEAWLDAAFSLMPEGLCPSVGQNVHHFTWYAHAQVLRGGEPHMVGEGRSRHDGSLAVLAMVLRCNAK